MATPSHEETASRNQKVNDLVLLWTIVCNFMPVAQCTLHKETILYRNNFPSVLIMEKNQLEISQQCKTKCSNVKW